MGTDIQTMTIIFFCTMLPSFSTLRFSYYFLFCLTFPSPCRCSIFIVPAKVKVTFIPQGKTTCKRAAAVRFPTRLTLQSPHSHISSVIATADLSTVNAYSRSANLPFLDIKLELT